MNDITVDQCASSYDDCSIRVYRSFTTIFYKCVEITINLLYVLHIMLTLCLMLLITHCAQNVAGIIGGSLAIALCSYTTNQPKL